MGDRIYRKPPQNTSRPLAKSAKRIFIWDGDSLSSSLKEAAVDHEPVLLDFGASWCPGCVQLDQAFQAPQVQAMVRSLHLVRVDIGTESASANFDVAAAYGLDLNKTGIPGLVLLSPLGKAEATTNDGLFDNALPNTPSEIIGFLKPHL